MGDLHFNGCDGLVTFPGGFEASTPPFCWSTHSFCSFGSFLLLLRQAYKVLQSSYFFIFLVTYSARLIFRFCVADLKAIQNVQNQPVPLFGRRIYFQKVRAFIFERVLFIPLEASRECLKCFLYFQPKKKKTFI